MKYTFVPEIRSNAMLMTLFNACWSTLKRATTVLAGEQTSGIIGRNEGHLELALLSLFFSPPYKHIQQTKMQHKSVLLLLLLFIFSSVYAIEFMNQDHSNYGDDKENKA